MAVFLETLQDREDKAILPARVVPDLKNKLPGLFGNDAPVNSVRAAMLVADKTQYFPRRTLYPIDYVAVHAKTGADMDAIDVSAHVSLTGGGWQTDVRASLHDEPGFELRWEGDRLDPNSRKFSLMWAGNLPDISLDSRSGLVFADPKTALPPIGTVEFMKRRGKGNRWLRDVCAGYPVEISAFDLHMGLNVLYAALTPRDTQRKPFYLRLPLVLQTNLHDGVPGRWITP